jgi:Holliday junction resolvasome RuvABC endonuclease subunit
MNERGEAVLAGIDVSGSAVDVVLIGLDEHPGWHSFPIESLGPTLYDRACNLSPLVTGWIGWAQVDGAFIEEPMAPVLSDALKGLCYIVGAVSACVQRRVGHIAALKPAEWKLQTVGRGNATKAEIRSWALEQGFGEEAPQDAVDAYCVAVAGWRICEQAVQLRDAGAV